MLLIPILIGVVGMFTNNMKQPVIRVGVLADSTESLTIMQKIMISDNVECQMADRDSINTDRITGKYQFVIDYNKPIQFRETIENIEILINNKNHELMNDLSKTERLTAMILTAYLVIATVYATRILQDKESGTMERFCLAGKKRADYTCGNLISTGVIVLFQVSIAFLLFLVVDKGFTLNITKTLLAIGMITAITTLYGVLITFFSKKEMNANIIASSIAIILSILGGTFVAVEKMPQVLRVLSNISPIRWIILIMR